MSSGTDDAAPAPKSRRRARTPGDAPKLEQFSIRLPPKLKQGLELLARAQHRSLSQAVEWALLVGLNSFEVERDRNLSLGELLDKAWQKDSEMRRLLVIYDWAPALLSFEDLVACELVEKSSERNRIYDSIPADEKIGTGDAYQKAMEEDPEAVFESTRRRMAEETRLVEEFYDFCELVWPAIKEIAQRRSNAGQTTQNVSIMQQLGFDGLMNSMYLDAFRTAVLDNRDKLVPLTLDQVTAFLDDAKAKVGQAFAEGA